MLDGLPDKRLYWSIISDYSITTGLCELIDNALDLWMKKKPRPALHIGLTLDAERQLIEIKDDAGGVREEDLRMLIAPGASKNDPYEETVGVFGVGSKRAVVALAANVSIKTRFSAAKSFQIDITNDWLKSPDWDIPHYQIPDIEKGVTAIELTSLRKTLNERDIPQLVQHLGETYEWFLQIENCHITVNGTNVRPLAFDNWAYPPNQAPKEAPFAVPVYDEEGKLRMVSVDITAGLVRDRDPVADNYGVYIYCNHRLIVKELKDREVGYYVGSEAGVPHPDASLCRALVRINGGARLMPWNSSKSGINFSHEVFQGLRPTLIQLVKHFSSLSRRTKDDWPEKVFKYDKGEVEIVDVTPLKQGKKLALPPLPRVFKPHVETLKSKNRELIEDKPWTLGLVESVAAVDLIAKQKLETRNRIALLLLDSNFEIALKEFIVHRHDLFPVKTYTDLKIQELFKSRHQVITEVTSKISIPKKLIEKAQHYYSLRNKMVHERATVDIIDRDVENYRKTIQEVLQILFALDLSYD